MAPEQLDGRETDIRTDIFAFGIVLYEMLTGKSAFPARTSMDATITCMKETIAPISSVRPGIPQALDILVARCLARDPEQRWQSIPELKANLRNIGI